MYKEDTIAAVATPIGEGGVGIVRVSGPEAERIVKEIFVRGGGRNGRLRSHTLHQGTIQDPKSGAALDQVLLALMRRPRSYTGEDVAEIHCHGGPFLVRRILELVLSRGARQAEAGEFTKRAFLNGRLDLAQAEAVLDLTRARTESGARLALEQARGELSRWVDELREGLVDILVQVEAAIDFPEEEIELLRREELAKRIEKLIEKIAGLISSYEWGRLFREGARLCITGKPNVGKSSLLNALLGEERVIVTPVPGTTRDVIEEGVDLNGLPVVLWDTAGIREARDEVEKIGVGFSWRYLNEADGALVVLDGSSPLSSEDLAVLEATKEKKGLIVVNKIDLPQKIDLEQVGRNANGRDQLFVSAKEGSGLKELKPALRDLFIGIQGEPPMVVTHLRHKTALVKAEEALKRALGPLVERLPPEMVAVELQEARDALEEIVGKITNENILEHIFSNFCIGK